MRRQLRFGIDKFNIPCGSSAAPSGTVNSFGFTETLQRPSRVDCQSGDQLFATLEAALPACPTTRLSSKFRLCDFVNDRLAASSCRTLHQSMVAGQSVYSWLSVDASWKMSWHWLATIRRTPSWRWPSALSFLVMPNLPHLLVNLHVS